MSRPHTNKKAIDMKSLTQIAGLATGLLLTGPAAAIEFQMGSSTLAWTNKLSLGAAVRVEERDPQLVGIANGGQAFSTNGDDGNLAWDKGDVVSAAAKWTSDLSWSYGEFGAFIRGSYVGNPVLHRADYFDPNDYGAGKEFGQDERAAKEAAVRSHVGSDFDLLDAYVFGRFDVGTRALNVKLGRQVLNWGESVLVQHGLNALIAADVNQLRVPGFEVEEVQIPVGMALVSLDLVENVGIEGFYQFEWQNTIIDAAGTYWATNDFAGIGGTQANLGFGRAGENAPSTTLCFPPPPPPTLPGDAPGTFCVPYGSTVPRGADVEPSNGGQFGAKLSVFVPWLNDMDLAFYGANYHSRLPLVSGTSRQTLTSAADDANYFIEYPEDIQIYGVSFNTTVELLDVALQGEYSMKVDQPLQIDDVEILLNGLGAPNQINAIPGGSLGNQYMRGWRRHDVSQADITLTKVIGPIAWLGSDQLSAFIEVAGMHVHDLPPAEVLAYDAPGTYTLNAGTAAMNPSTALGLPVVPYDAYASATSWGYKAAARFTYNNVLGALTVEPTLLYQHDVSGISPTPILNFIEGRQQVNAIISVGYLQAWSFDMGYVTYFGGGAQNLLADRDYVDFAVKYAF
jgi:hypothetical protein